MNKLKDVLNLLGLEVDKEYFFKGNIGLIYKINSNGEVLNKYDDVWERSYYANLIDLITGEVELVPASLKEPFLNPLKGVKITNDKVSEIKEKAKKTLFTDRELAVDEWISASRGGEKVKSVELKNTSRGDIICDGKDVTDEVLKAAFIWFIHKAILSKRNEVKIGLPNMGTLTYKANEEIKEVEK